MTIIVVFEQRCKTSSYVVRHTVAAGVHLWSLGVLAAAGCGIGSAHAMLAGFTTEEAEADTVADQGLKRVNRIFGGLNKGIWPKTEELTIFYEVCWKKCLGKKMNSRCLESVAQELVSAMMTSAYLLEKAVSNKDDLRAATMTSALLFERNQKAAEAQELVSAVMTSAYLLEETEISNADVSIYVEEAGGSTRNVIRTITEAVGTITRAVGTITEAVGTITEAVGTITRAVGTITRAVGRNHHLKGKYSVAEIKSY
ncbi:hypothetical protein F511_44880 [Dorcoceras hygrometricum]|uniref:Uncharacterized protein n=1 Tax=Dorcoceras hygrometricum TaxID=472368 RepID=A0A2Z7A512_9LAMI|nr:hypothetical protein F511_44880 [Dorcoceras hygrometricum]